MDDRLTKIRSDIASLLEQRTEKQDRMDALLAGAEERGAGNDELNDAESAEFNELRNAIKTLDGRRKLLEERANDIQATEEARAAAEASAARFGGTTRVQVVADEKTYRKQGANAFFRDMFAWKFNADPLAGERLMRHAREVRIAEREERATDTSSFAGLVVPQYLVDDFAAVARAGRPFLNFVGSRDLPADGMTLNVPRGNTGTVVVSQTAENDAVANQDMDNSDVVVPVRTIAGQQDVSRQALDRGRNTDEEIMSDLAEAYTAELDRQSIDGTGANGQHLGLLSTTDVASITVTSTSAVTQLKLLADAIQRVHTNRYQAATVIVVHPRRWAYWSQSTDSQGRPLVTPRAHGPFNAFGVGDLTQADGIVGDIYGLPVLTDPNIPSTKSTTTTQGSTEDRIIISRHSDLRLYEDDPMPRRVRFEETTAGSLQVKIVAWDYSAWTAGRYPDASIVLLGSGLTTPVFG